jgi:hypothetical protein
MIQPRATVVALAVAFLLPGLAGAWNSTGHKTLALIAFRSLADRDQGRMIELLQSHPHKAFLLAGAPDDPHKRNEWMVMQAATWPDWVRKGNPDPDITKKYSVPERHYINLPLVVPAYQDAFKKATLSSAKHDVVKDLPILLTTLKSAETTPEEKAVALCWVLHLVGDIHQPLHCSNLYSEAFPAPTGDRGGNLFIVRDGERSVRLHTLWDDLPGSAQDYDAIDKLSTELSRSLEYQREKFREALAVMEIGQWAKESNALAWKAGYLEGKLKGAFNNAQDIAQVTAPDLPAGYKDSALTAARKQITLAGYRLADKLGGALRP